MKQAVIYARVSTDEQGKGYSLPTQIEACQKYAAEHGYTVAATFSDDYTGTTMERPALNELRAFCGNGAGVEVVICYELDRLARKTVYQLLIEEELAHEGIAVEYVLGNYENTPEGQLMKQIRATVAEYERAKILERMMRGKRGRAKAGFPWPGRVAPYGYEYVREEHKGWLVVNEEEAGVIRRIFQWYVFGDEQGDRCGGFAIARKLSELRIPTRMDKVGKGKTLRGYGVWCKATIDQIVRNETYCGTWHYRTKAGDVTCPVPAIISRELWEAAQRQIEDNKRLAGRNTKREYLMQHRMVCGDCRRAFRARYKRRKRIPDKGYYECSGMRAQQAADNHYGSCKGYLAVDTVDSAVWETIKDLMKNPEPIIRGMREEQAEQQKKGSVIRERVSMLRKKEADLDNEGNKLLALYRSTNNLPQHLLEMQLTELATLGKSYQSEIAELEQRLQEAAIPDSDIAQVEAYCRESREGIDNYTFEEKRRALDLLKVTATVYRRQDEPTLIDLRGIMPKTQVCLPNPQPAQAQQQCPARSFEPYSSR